MGSRNPDRISIFTHKARAETVADMIAQGWSVHATCPMGRCGNRLAVDLQKVARVKGPAFSLWNKPQACKRPGCSGRMVLYGWAPGMPEHVALICAEERPVELPAWRRGREAG